MKIKGETFDAPAPVEIRVNSGNKVVVLHAKAVLDYTEFEALVPRPEPREVMRPGGKKSKDPNDPKYQEKLQEYGKKQTYWMMLKSLEATDGLEWEKVDRQNPDTWHLIEEELRAAFTPFGQMRVMNGVLQANGLDENMLSASRDSFLP